MTESKVFSMFKFFRWTGLMLVVMVVGMDVLYFYAECFRMAAINLMRTKITY